MSSRVPQGSRGTQFPRGVISAAALVAVAALLLVPAGASAASPVLEFVVPGHGLPVRFTTESGAVTAEMNGFNSVLHCTASHGEGEITGPRSAIADYQFTGCVTEKGFQQKCKSADAQEEEITTGLIDAELVFIDQAEHEVGVLLDPSGGTYIAFECGGKPAEGRGPFLAPVGPINKEATTFTATLSQSGSAQTPDEYETLTGEKRQAIPTGSHDSSALVTTGVEAAFTVDPSASGEIKAITAAEVLAEEHARQVAEEVRKHEAAIAIAIAADAKKHQEEEEAATAKKHDEEAKKREAERRLKSKLKRARLLAKALRACEKQPKKRRARCVASAHKKYGPKPKEKGLHGGLSTGSVALRGEPSVGRLDY
jgi:hypothetical protein